MKKKVTCIFFFLSELSFISELNLVRKISQMIFELDRSYVCILIGTEEEVLGLNFESIK